jgi:hypothetical protein
MDTPTALGHRKPLRRRRREGGFALVFAIFTIAALLLAISSAMVTGASNGRAATNYRAASQVRFVAESGLTDAIANINGTGVINYQTDIVGTWSTRFGTGTKTFAAIPGYLYAVTTTVGANVQNNGILVSTATGPDGAKNVAVARLARSNNPSTAPGVIYLATDGSTDSSFSGDAFVVDGNDHNYTGGAGPGGAVPGITTRNATNSTEAITSLASGELDNVQGLGYQAGPPVVPSIGTSTSAPTVAQMNQFITDVEALAGQSCKCNTYNNGCIQKTENVAACQTGSDSAPKVTWFDSGTTIPYNGSLTGDGVLIFEGDLNVNGTINYKGLLLVKGKLTIDGNATIYGSVWAQGVTLTVGGSAIVFYSTQALQLANSVAPSGAIMTPMTITSMADCNDIGPGVGGCPN